ncbi:MAG: hypothetical protein ACTSYQ_04120 [Candidatus Odinarchaeia archaeon]
MKFSDFKFKPNIKGDGIYINDIQVKFENIIHSNYRVDIGINNKVIYLIEHIVAALVIVGITDVRVYSNRENWNFYRPEDRAAYSLNLKPSNVIGDERGIINFQLVKKIIKAKKIKLDNQLNHIRIKETFKVEHPKIGVIKIEPLKEDMGAIINLVIGNDKIVVKYNANFPHLNMDTVRKITESTTPFLIGFNKNSIYHCVGDILGDLIGIGGLFNFKLTANLKGPYHYLTHQIIQLASKKQ